MRSRSDSPTKHCTEPGCRKPLRARGYCSGHWKRYFADRPKYAITCVVCAAHHLSARPDGKFCSDACRALDYRSRQRTEAQAASFSRRCRAAQKLALAAKGKHGRRIWVVGRCARCGQGFTGTGSSELRFCSRRCKALTVAAARRARKRGNEAMPYSRYPILERDRWQCHICRRAVRRTAVVPDPLAPTIDHLIPIAGGGADAPWNVATAHFLCNSTKGAKGGGEQLALIG